MKCRRHSMPAVCSDQRRAAVCMGPGRAFWSSLSLELGPIVHDRAAVQ